MKKIFQEQRLRFLRISKKRKKRNKRSKEKKIRRNRRRSSSDYREIGNINYKTISGPNELGCHSSDGMNCLLPWLAKLRVTTVNQDQPVFIDFSKSKKAEVVGFILMQAEIDRIKSIKGDNFIRGNSPKDPVTAQVFHQVGLSKLLGIRENIPITDKDVVYWKHTHGTKIDADKAGKLIVEIAQLHNLDDDVIDILFTGVGEAITNSVMHAYPDDGKNTRFYGKKKWWMFTGINENMLHVIVCDLGIGIPSSLKNKHPDLFQRFKYLFKSENHSELIEIAMEEGRSRSEQPHRGLGMVELKKFINFTHNGHLGIFSQKGVYVYQGDGKENIERSRNLKDSIMGTVVAWSVPLDALALIGNESNEKKDN
jgi:hypothetical protein